MEGIRNGITVNHLPALTWNRLGVNRGFVEKDDLPESESGADFVVKNGENIKRERRPTSEAEEWADSFSQGIRREACVSSKQAIYQDQEFATGLGREFTDLITEIVPETDIFTIEEGQKPEKPVILSWNLQNGAKTAAQQIIHVKKGAEATFLFVEKAGRETSGNMALETKVILEEGAVLHLMKVNLLGRGFVLMDDSAAIVEDGAVFDFLQMTLGSAKTYAGCYADQCGDESKFLVNSGYLGEQKDLIDINYIACQRGKKTSSNIYVKGSLKNEAKKIFRGTIDFRKGTKGSVGDEQEDVLIMDEGVVNKTVPVILTEEEDVDGRHGATIGNLTGDILYYLGTRGIDKEAAEMLMTKGRLLSIAHMIPDQETVDQVDTYIMEAF